MRQYSSIYLAALATLIASAPVCATERKKGEYGEIITLGTSGGPTLRASRSEPANLLIVGGKRYLVDAGVGTSHQLVRAGVGATEIDVFFITHIHPDHTLDLVHILADRVYHSSVGRPIPPLRVLGPPGTKHLVNTAVEYVLASLANFALYGNKIGMASDLFEVTEIPGNGAIFADGVVTVRAVENTHYILLDPAKRDGQLSFSYRFDTPSGSIVFSGDTGPSEALTDLAKGADVLVAENANPEAAARAITGHSAMRKDGEVSMAAATSERQQLMINHTSKQHLPITDLGIMAAEAKVGAVILTHFGPYTHRIDVDEDAASVRRLFKGDVRAAEDLDKFCFQRERMKSGTPLSDCPASQ